MTVADMDYALMERLDRMSLQMTEISEELERQREMREMLLGLTELAGPVMQMVTAKATELEEKGYFTFAQGGLEIADRVVTSFDEDDIKALFAPLPEIKGDDDAPKKRGRAKKA